MSGTSAPCTGGRCCNARTGQSCDFGKRVANRPSSFDRSTPHALKRHFSFASPSERLAVASSPLSLSQCDIKPGCNDYSSTAPGPQIRKITENQVAQRGTSDQLHIAKRSNHRCAAKLESMDHQIMPVAP